MAFAVLFELLFLFDQTPFCFLELCGQELTGAVGLVLPVPQVLLDVQGGQSLSHLSCRFGVVADIAHPKRVDRLADRARDDVITHHLHDIFHDLPRSLGFVQIQLLDNPFQPGATENLIGD